MSGVLETEWAYYEALKPHLLVHHEGRFALVVGAKLLGVFGNHSKAYSAGLAECGNVPMLIHKIEKREPILIIGERIVGVRYG